MLWCPVCRRSQQGASACRKFAPKCTNEAKSSLHQGKKTTPKVTIPIKLQMKNRWGCTFVRHFRLLLLKIMVVIGCGGTYEPPWRLGAPTTRTNFAPLTPGLCENGMDFFCGLRKTPYRLGTHFKISICHSAKCFSDRFDKLHIRIAHVRQCFFLCVSKHSSGTQLTHLYGVQIIKNFLYQDIP